MTARILIEAALRLRERLDALRFAPPVAHVYDPWRHAWAPYETYLERFGEARGRIVLLGMNPGPFGMLQTGVPFGEVAAVRDWMGITGRVEPPAAMHPKRPIEGFDCRRSEVSGARLWGWAARRFGTAQAFFAQAFVLNWCPLVFLEASGRNRTPVQLPAAEARPLAALCDAHLAEALATLSPRALVGIGGFAADRLRAVAGTAHGPVVQILHPSPASPAANRGWADAVDRTLAEHGLLPPAPAAAAG